MISVWWVVGLLLLSLCTGLATSVLMVVLGVQGVMLALKKRLESAEIGLENLDRRLTTEVKARAAVKGVEARGEARTLAQVASDRLEAERLPAATGRPSIISMIRR